MTACRVYVIGCDLIDPLGAPIRFNGVQDVTGTPVSFDVGRQHDELSEQVMIGVDRRGYQPVLVESDQLL